MPLVELYSKGAAGEAVSGGSVEFSKLISGKRRHVAIGNFRSNRQLREQTGKPRLNIYRSISVDLAAIAFFSPGSGACRMSVAQILADLHSAAPLVAPSLLACDFGNLQAEVRRVEEAGAGILHLDVMDGHFVPNISFGLPIVEAVRRVTDLPLDVHLMISEPARYVRQFRDAGADLLTFHVEAVAEPEALLAEIRSLGAAAGITLNPPTPVSVLENCLDGCDLVLVMSVMPGFGGQQFDGVALDKLRWLREWGAAEVLLSVDGGINSETLGPCAAAGADLFVAGTALFSQPDYARFLGEMTDLARTSKDVRV